MAAKSFQDLLFEGALTALRTLTLEELTEQRDTLIEMNLPDDLAEFPWAVLSIAIAEKQLKQMMN